MANDERSFLVDRRKFIGMVAGSASLAGFSKLAFADKIPTKAKIVILGAGAGGLAMANRLANRLSGVKKENYSVTNTTDWIADGIELVP